MAVRRCRRAAAARPGLLGQETTDGRLIAAKCTDIKPTIQVAIVAFPDSGNAFICGSSGQNALNMNDKGVWFASNSLEAVRASDYSAGYGKYSAASGGSYAVVSHALRFCDTAKQALNYFMSMQPSGPGQTMFADVSGDAYVLEQSPAFRVVRKSGEFGENGNFIYMRNTALTDAGGVASLGGLAGKFYPHGGWAQNPPAGVSDPGGYADIQMGSVRTDQTMYNMLTQYAGKIDVNFDEMLWRYAGATPKDPFSTAEYRATKAYAWETPLNLENETVTVSVPDNGPNGVMYVCTGPVGTVGQPYEPGPDDDYYQIGGTHTFYELDLTTGPADVVGNAMLTAKSDIAAAYQKLMWIPYGAVHAELMPIFNQASAEYYAGVNWTTRASEATGNDQLLDYAQALTAYTRAECHAEQISEAIVKPPATPSDLGLHPYIYRQYGF